MFRSVDGKQFEDAIAACPASPAFRRQFARFGPFRPWMDVQAVIHDGALKVSGSFKVPGYCTLIVGDLDVDGVIDLRSDFDEGGLLVVIGNATCRHFISEYARYSFIDGDLAARDSIMNGFGDSGLSVIGSLRTRLFIGCDIWAEVGAGAVMDYGVGYCLPIGYTDAEAAAIEPRHDESETARIVVPQPNEEGYLLNVEQFVDRIRAGQPIFKW